MKTQSQILTQARRLLSKAKEDLVERKLESLGTQIQVVTYLLWVLDD